jgi:hypothetical protein
MINKYWMDCHQPMAFGSKFVDAIASDGCFLKQMSAAVTKARQ